MPLLLAIHLLSVVIWVGGMFFAVVILGRATKELEIPQFVPLWGRVLKKFFHLVWIAVFLLPLTGYGMIHTYFASFRPLPHYISIMATLGVGMCLVFIFTYVTAYQRFSYMLQELLYPEAGLYMQKIRLFILINLLLGITTIVVATTGRIIGWCC
ncbi:MAG: hypothetical protein H7832_02515 [Magnetococcus sp. DMHC-6]